MYERVVHGLSSVSEVFESAGVSEDVLDHFLDPAESDMVIDTLVHDGRGSTDVSSVVSGLSGGLEYTYVVSALSLSGEGERSDSVGVSTSPGAPSEFGSVDVRSDGVDLVWSGPAVSTGSGVTGYIVYMNDGAGGAELSTVVCDGTGSTSAACRVDGLSGGREYLFAVSALSGAGEGLSLIHI